MKKIITDLFGIILLKLNRVFSAIRNLFLPDAIFGKISIFLKKEFNKVFRIKPRNENDYYTLGRYLISKRLINAIIFIIGAAGLYYLFIVNPINLFAGGSGDIKTYNYNSLFIRFASGNVKIKAKSGYTAYCGEVSGGKANGEGTLYRKSGDIRYKGEFKDNKYNGQGTLYMDNKIYEGEFRDNCFEGEGKLIRPNGSTEYKGTFHDGEKSGAGELYDEGNNLVFQGNFANDELMYGDFPGKSTGDAAKMYTGKRTIYYDDKHFVVQMKDINAYYEGSANENYLDESVQIKKVFVKSSECVLNGKRIKTLSEIKEIAGVPSFEGFSDITMPEAVVLEEGIRTDEGFEDAKEVVGYRDEVSLYLVMFEYDNVQYTFYSYERGDEFVMYAIEQ